MERQKNGGYLKNTTKCTKNIKYTRGYTGHYVQLVYSNKASSIIKSIFQNSTMIEGWAVYSELMMLENGFGNNEPEMWLMYYKWNLRSVSMSTF